VSRRCTSCGGEWTHTWDRDWLADAKNRKLRAENERLRADIERLREALQESACACSSIRECASEWAKDGKCPHLIARVALEGKP